jgi:hypothetical protein
MTVIDTLLDGGMDNRVGRRVCCKAVEMME